MLDAEAALVGTVAKLYNKTKYVHVIFFLETMWEEGKNCLFTSFIFKLHNVIMNDALNFFHDDQISNGIAGGLSIELYSSSHTHSSYSIKHG